MSRIGPITSDPAYRNGGVALAMAAAAILAALAFEHIGGLVPCDLCLEQRIAYYAGVPALFIALVLIAAERPKPAALLFFAIALGFLANAGLGVYHAGVEWKFWPGPTACTPPLGELKPLGRALIEKLETARVVRCDEAAWRLFGLSLAGWNVMASFMIFAVSLQAAFAASSRQH
jgi:disulfide bond formation protein DsbB